MKVSTPLRHAPTVFQAQASPDLRLPPRERGVAVLAAALVLLVAMTATAVFVHRALLISQRGVSNEQQALQASMAAEAGVAWALAMANDPRTVDASCKAGAGGGESFSTRYLGPALATAAPSAPPSPIRAHVACRIEDDALRCLCLPPGSTSEPESPAESDHGRAARFAVVFEMKSPQLVLLISHGCAAGAQGCVAGAALMEGIPGQGAVQATLQREAIGPGSSNPGTGSSSSADAGTGNGTALGVSSGAANPAGAAGSVGSTGSAASHASPVSTSSLESAAPPRWIVVPGSWHDS